MTLPDLEVNFVDSLPEAERFMRWLGERRATPLAIDTETTGLGWADTVRLIQFGDGAGGWAVPVRDWRGVAASALSAVAASQQPVIFHNSQFDLHKLENDGFEIPAFSAVHDTLVMSRLKDPARSAGLKPLCERLFGTEATAGQGLLKQEMADNRWTWATIPDDHPSYWQYGVLDTCLTALAAEQLLPQVPAAVYEREMAVLGVMYGAERRGMRIDPDYTSALLAEWREELAGLRSQLKEAGLDRPGSNHEVTLILRGAGWEPDEFTPTGLPALDKKVLNALEADARFAAVASPLLRYRRLAKWCSTYLERFLRDGPVLHPEINTLGARTGRMTVRNPGLHTLPSKEASIRNCVVPRDGSVLCAIDYRQMEPRLTASYANDENLISAFLADEDLYTYCAEQVYGAGNGNEYRGVFKAVMLARAYGAGPAKMASTAGVSEDQIQAVIDGLDRRFPDLARFFSDVQHQAKVRLALDGEPYVVSHGGRRVVGEADKIYAMVNALIQASSADVFKEGIVAVDAAGLGDRVVLPIHDELLFDFPKKEADEMGRAAQEAMEDHTSFRVPMICEVTNNLTRWGDAYDE